ncbi:hypothetical protein [uncultured Phenylobacterium sp.]|uniref:hypothetical protein n=1 Tax=uncultured Phenylobacterium sp. TaxID=349273 RepID=UPI0025E495A5|nr:hypothetical protein [uncultured Phenylobacterium sp.]
MTYQFCAADWLSPTEASAPAAPQRPLNFERPFMPEALARTAALGFLALEGRHQAFLDPLEGRGKAGTLVTAADFGLDFTGFAGGREKPVRGHALGLGGVDASILAQDAAAHIERQHRIADPGFPQNLFPRRLAIHAHTVSFLVMAIRPASAVTRNPCFS